MRNAEVLSLFHRANEFGISFDNLTVDYGKAVERSRQVVKRLVGGLKSLMKRYGIDVIPGLASVPAPGRVLVDGQEEIEAGNIIVATGALNKGLPPLPVDGEQYHHHPRSPCDEGASRTHCHRRGRSRGRRVRLPLVHLRLRGYA